MSNIFINRNRSQGGYGMPVHNQKFLTTDQIWLKRGEITKKGNDTFYKKSLKFGANLDLQDKHVGMQWTLEDACDTVKLNQHQMEDRFRKTENSLPLWKAFNTYENTN